MSKLIDRLNKMAKAVPQPIGFKAAPSTLPKAKILLIASMAPASNVSDADAILISRLGSRSKALSEITRPPADIPWGLFSEDASRIGFESVAKAGGDFVVFPASASVTMPEDDKTGKILQVEASLNEGLIRAINELPVDAVLITQEQTGKYALTWQHLMSFQRCADLFTKPLLVSTPSNVSANELQALWEAGVSGMVVRIEDGQPAQRLQELRDVVDKLVLPPRHKLRKIETPPPHIYIGRENEIEPEED